MSRARAVVKGRRILALDVLGEVRRAMKLLRRVERFLVQQQRAAKRATEHEHERAELRELARQARTPRPAP